MIKDQNCSSLSVSLHRTSETFISNDSQILETIEVNSPADSAPKAITKVGFTNGDWAIASANVRSKTGRERILNVHLSAWAIVTHENTWSMHTWKIDQRREKWIIQKSRWTRMRSHDCSRHVRQDLINASSQCRTVGSSSCCLHMSRRSIDRWEPTTVPHWDYWPAVQHVH